MARMEILTLTIPVVGSIQEQASAEDSCDELEQLLHPVVVQELLIERTEIK